MMIGSDTKSYYHAQNDPIWQVAMDEEFNSLRKNATWELVLPSTWEENFSMQVGKDAADG